MAVSSVLSALGVVMLYLGSMVEVLDISMAVIASLICVFAVIEYGKGYPWLIFSVTAILSLLLLPNKTPAVMYAAFFGFYPIIKEKLERLPRVISWLLKEIIFNVAFAIMAILVMFVFTIGEVEIDFPYVLGIVLLGELTFVLYDIAMTRLISLYIFKLRKRFKIK
jgi:hypothetical protein